MRFALRWNTSKVILSKSPPSDILGNDTQKLRNECVIMYKINTRVLAWDKDWIIPGTITAIEDGLYKIKYDCGGYDWLLSHTANTINP